MNSCISYEDGMAKLYRENPELGLEVLNEAIKSGDQEMFMVILGHIIRARGSVASLAKEAALNENTLHRTLSERGNPTLKTLLNIFNAMNFELSVTCKTSGSPVRAQS